MTLTTVELDAWLQAPENEHLELKEAKKRFDFEELVRYCAALANEGGGRLVLGVTDKRPRRVVGSRAFSDLERTKTGLLERLHLRIEAERLEHADGPVIVFTVPSRPQGVPVQYKGAYWMRSGEALVPMTPDQLKAIFAEAEPDFSAEICAAATLDDLTPEAVERFRDMWQQESGNPALAQLSVPRLLEDAELLVNGEITYAALVLFGTRKALGRHLAQSEVIFEYRSQIGHIAAQQRKEYREGFLLFRDDLWATINLRNDLYTYQVGFQRRKQPAFNEVAVREAILNAVSHRDYRQQGSVFVRQWPTQVEVLSPGGFPGQVTAANLLWRQDPRNRRIAESFARCGLVERAGQGVDLMFENCVREGKLPPDYGGSDDGRVSVVFHGEVRYPHFLRFMQRVEEAGIATQTDDVLVLDAVNRELPIPERLEERIESLCERGLLDRTGDKVILAEKLNGVVREAPAVGGVQPLPLKPEPRRPERPIGEPAPLPEYRSVQPGRLAATINYAAAQSNLIVALRRYQGEYSILPQLPLHLAGRTLVPAISVHRKLHVDWRHDHVQEIEAPLMVIEILSTGQTVEDLIAKADAYFEGGVQSCWIVQPVLETIAVLMPGEKPKIHGSGELTDPATAITVKVEEVFS